MVGVVDAVEHITRSNFSRAGDHIVLLGQPTAAIGGSEYLQCIHGLVAGAPPACDLAAERALIETLLAAIGAGAVRSAHDCSDGGLAVALAECAIMDRARPLGARVDLSPWAALPLRALLFGEAQGRALVSTADPARVLAIAAEHGVPARDIGTVDGGARLRIRVGAREFSASLAELDDAYFEAIPRIMSRPASAAADFPSTTAV
jgi:phosphoribosylformylglycinamidine synthase